MAIFLKSKETVFIHIPKTAGESLSNWLTNFANGQQIGWKHCSINDLTITEYKHSFTIVRHPFDRFTSWYSHLVRELKTKGSKRNRETRKIIAMCEKEEGINSYIDYCLNDYSPHYLIWKPQISFINSNTEIFRYENLNTDFKKIQKSVECFEDLPTVNKSNRINSSLSNKSKEVLRKIYKEDFINFNYREDV